MVALWKSRTAANNLNAERDLRFASIPALEMSLDGTEDTFAKYFFAIYHCSPDEESGVNDLRRALSAQFPEKCIPVGPRFVLIGFAACKVLTSYYQALSGTETLTDEFREYSRRRQTEIADAHEQSQSLPFPIDLTEGQLARDYEMEFLTCLALSNRQIVFSPTK
jgi:hypothetical protein